MKLQIHFPYNIRISKKIFYTISFFFIMLVITLTTYFLYDFVYKSIIYTKQTVELKLQVAQESFDRKAFETVLYAIEEKQKPMDTSKILEMDNFFIENRIPTTTPSMLTDEIKKEGAEYSTSTPPMENNALE